MSLNETANLRAALETASARLSEATRRLAPKHTGGEMDEYAAALQALMMAERSLAQSEGRAYAVTIECPLVWDTGAPLPTLLQTDYQTLLFFFLANDQDGIGRIMFEGCLATYFGSPGDESFQGHVLYGSGFEPYRAMQVMNSSWIEGLRKINEVHPGHSPERYQILRHFVLPFHDSTFECVAQSFKVSKIQLSLADAVRMEIDSLF